MESSSHRKKMTKLDKLKEAISQRVEKVIQIVGTAITSYCLSFIFLPSLIAFTFLVLCLTASKPPNPGDSHAPSVKKMFLAVKEHPISTHRFETISVVIASQLAEKSRDYLRLCNAFKDWWEETCYDPENTRKSAHIIATSRYNILSEKMQREILRLHEKILEIQAQDNVHDGIIHYRDVCMNSFSGVFIQAKNQTNPCATDAIIKMFECMRNHKSLTLNLRMDSDTRILWGVMERHDSVDSSLHSAVDLWCSKQVGKKVFFGQTICMVDDHMHTAAISAGCVRVNYFLKDITHREKVQSRIWLRELEKNLTSFTSDLMKITYVTSETLNIQWWDLVRLTILNEAILCLIYFVFSLLIFSTIENSIQAIYMSLFAVASLVMTIICTYYLHSVLYETPRFNLEYCIIFVSVAHYVFLLVFVESYLEAQDPEQPRGEAQTAMSFIECYVLSFLSNFAYFFAFSSIFGVSVMRDSLPSFQALCVMSCIGYAIAFFYQVTLLPASFYLYKSRICNIIEIFCLHLATVRKQPMQYSVPEAVFNDNNKASNSQIDVIVNKNEKKKTIEKSQKFKSKLKQCYKRFTKYVVCDHMRAVCALLYLTYLSLSCVGTVHFIEGITPKLLISKESMAFRYYTAAESYFKPYGPQFVVYGVVHDHPWKVNVLKELYKVHKSLSEMETVDSNLSVNWFQSYFEYTVNDKCIRCGKVFSSRKDNQKTRSPSIANDGNAAEFSSHANYSGKILNIKGANFWSSKSNNISDDFWKTFDWRRSWNYFNRTPVYQNNKDSIEIVNTGPDKAHHDNDHAEGLQVRFRWLYYAIDSSLPSKQHELITRFEEIMQRTNRSLMTMLNFDAPELDWWISIKADRFSNCFTSLITFGLVVALFLLVLIKRALVVIWSCIIVVSVCFGIVGFLSLSGIRSDPLSIPCVLFAIPCTIFVTFNMLSHFFDSAYGRAESAAASLKKSGPRSMLFCALLFFSSLTLTSSSSYVYKAPLVGLIILAFILMLHNLLLVPFLLTVFPPRKKQQKISKKNVIVKQTKKENADNVEMKEQNNSVVKPIVNCEASKPISSV